MFDYNGPIAATNVQRTFLEDFGSKIPVAQKDALRTASHEISPVPALLGGMEVLFVLAVEISSLTGPTRAAVLATLGVVARAVAEGQYGGAEKRDRAYAIQDWAAHEISPAGTAPVKPDVDPLYTTIVPEPVVPTPPVPPA